MSSCRAISAQNGSWRVEVAEHEAAAVEEEEQRPRLALLARVVEAQADLAAGPRAGEVADHRQLAHRRVRDVARGQHHRRAPRSAPTSWARGPGRVFR